VTGFSVGGAARVRAVIAAKNNVVIIGAYHAFRSAKPHVGATNL
jgi:hypothetical protein